MPSFSAPTITAAGACCCLSRSETSSGSPDVSSTTSTVTSPAAVSRVTVKSASAFAALRLRLLARRRELGPELVAFARTLVQEREGLAGGDGLDPARARADRGLGEDHERPDLGGRADVRAAAELAREAVDLDHAHDVAVLLAEEHLRAELAGLVDRRLERPHGPADEDLLVHELLDLLALLRRQRLLVREVETELVGPDGRARLRDVLAQHPPQRLVQEMGRRVVRHRREAH